MAITIEKGIRFVFEQEDRNTLKATMCRGMDRWSLKITAHDKVVGITSYEIKQLISAFSPTIEESLTGELMLELNNIKT